MHDASTVMDLPSGSRPGIPDLRQRWLRAYRSGHPFFWLFVVAWALTACGTAWVLSAHAADPTAFLPEPELPADVEPGGTPRLPTLSAEATYAAALWGGLALALPYIAMALSAAALLWVASRSRAGGCVLWYEAVIALATTGAAAIAGIGLRDVPILEGLLPLAVGVAALAVGIAILVARARRSGNLRLLVLRVFGCDANSAFTFGSLERYWRFLGSGLTIADPSYIRYRFSLRYPGTRLALLRIGLLFSAVFAAVRGGFAALATVEVEPAEFGETTGAIDTLVLMARDLTGPEQTVVVTMIGWVVVAVAAVVPLAWHLRARFAKSVDALQAQLQRTATLRASWNGTHASGVFYCHDDLWKRAIDGMVAMADVVIMDLRGFTPERVGCRYELGLLAARVPLHRIVLLVDRESVGAIEETLTEVSAELPESSPNLGPDAARVAVYVPGDRDRSDALRLVAELLATNPAGNERASTSLRERRQSAWERLLAGPRRVASWLGDRIDQLDIASASPAMQWRLIPLALLAIGVAFGYSLHAFADARTRVAAAGERRALRGAKVAAKAFRTARTERVREALREARDVEEPAIGIPRPLTAWIAKALDSMDLGAADAPEGAVRTAAGDFAAVGPNDWTHPRARREALRQAIGATTAVELVKGAAAWRIDAEIRLPEESEQDLRLVVRCVDLANEATRSEASLTIPVDRIDVRPSAYAWTQEQDALELRRRVLLLAAAFSAENNPEGSTAAESRYQRLRREDDNAFAALAPVRSALKAAGDTAGAAMLPPRALRELDELKAELDAALQQADRIESIRVPLEPGMDALAAPLRDAERTAWRNGAGAAGDAYQERSHKVDILTTIADRERHHLESLRTDAVAIDDRTARLLSAVDQWLARTPRDPRALGALCGEIAHPYDLASGQAWRAMGVISKLQDTVREEATARMIERGREPPSFETPDERCRSRPARSLKVRDVATGSRELPPRQGGTDPRLPEALALIELWLPLGRWTVGPIPATDPGTAIEVRLGDAVHHVTEGSIGPEDQAAFGQLLEALRQRLQQ